MKKVKLLFFSTLKEKMKESEKICEVRENETVSSLAYRLLEPLCGRDFIDRSLRYAINSQYAEADSILQEGDEVVFITPVAGG